MIIMLYILSNFKKPFFDTIGQFAKGHFVIQSEQPIDKKGHGVVFRSRLVLSRTHWRVLQFYFNTFPLKLLINTVFLSGVRKALS